VIAGDPRAKNGMERRETENSSRKDGLKELERVLLSPALHRGNVCTAYLAKNQVRGGEDGAGTQT
jgi:hypothetical protein